MQGTMPRKKKGESFALIDMTGRGGEKELSALFYEWGSYAQQVFLLPGLLLEWQWISRRAWAGTKVNINDI